MRRENREQRIEYIEQKIEQRIQNIEDRRQNYTLVPSLFASLYLCSALPPPLYPLIYLCSFSVCFSVFIFCSAIIPLYQFRKNKKKCTNDQPKQNTIEQNRIEKRKEKKIISQNIINSNFCRFTVNINYRIKFEV